MKTKIQLNEYYLGFDIGGTKCSVVLGDKNFNIHEKIIFATQTERSYQEIINDFKKHTYHLFEKYEKKDLIKNITSKLVFEAAISGDPIAKEIVNISADYLGIGLSVLIDIINPECIVIGSIYARNEALFKSHIEKILKREAIPAAKKVCKILPAALGDKIGDYAALCVALK